MRSLETSKKQILEHFGILNILKISNDYMSGKLLEGLYKLINRKHQFRELVALKTTCNPIDIQYLYLKTMDIQAEMDSYIQWLRVEFL